jgi:hypothetical protein
MIASENPDGFATMRARAWTVMHGDPGNARCAFLASFHFLDALNKRKTKAAVRRRTPKALFGVRRLTAYRRFLFLLST